MYWLGIVIFIVGLLISVALHELGHMIPAKAFGVKVYEYFIGFGPRIWSRQKGETEYGLKALPLGGYVRMAGMLPPAKPGHPDKVNSKGELGMVGQARQESLAELEPGEEHKAFYNLSAPKKLVVMFGGPVMNLILSGVLIIVSMSFIGVPKATNTLAGVSNCLPTIESGQSTCDAKATVPARAAGLKPGDTITSWDGQQISDWTQLQTAIASTKAGTGVVVTVKRGNHSQQLNVVPTQVTRVVQDAQGKALAAPDGSALTRTTTFVGISPQISGQPVSLGTALKTTWLVNVSTLKAIVTLPAGLYHRVLSALGQESTSNQSLVSIVGVGRMAGQVSSGGSGVVDLSVRAYSMLMLLASLNAALFAFNMIPLLPLDGGHIAGAIWEGLRRSFAKLRKAPDPGPVDTAKLLPIGQGVFILLLIVGCLLIWADIAAPV